MNEQNISGNIPPSQPEVREQPSGKSFGDLYKEVETTDQQEQEPERVPLEEEEEEEEEEPGSEPAEKRQRVSRLERLQQKKHELERQISALEAKEKQKDRKVQTRRLIELGAIAEKYLKCEGMDPKKFEAFLKGLVEQPEVKRYIQH